MMIPKQEGTESRAHSLEKGRKGAFLNFFWREVVFLFDPGDRNFRPFLIKDGKERGGCFPPKGGEGKGSEKQTKREPDQSLFLGGGKRRMHDTLSKQGSGGEGKKARRKLFWLDAGGKEKKNFFDYLRGRQ